MTARIIPLPARQDVRLSPQRLARKRKRAAVRTLVRDAGWAYQTYCAASDIDEQEPERAEVMYRAAIASDPTLAIAIVNLGAVRFRLGDPTGALELFDQARRVNPDCCEAWYNAGFVHLERGMHHEALRLLTRATEVDPQHADSWYNRAMAHYETGDRAAAKACFRRYVQLDATGDWANRARGYIREIDFRARQEAM